jgi:hypothetical protein
MQCIQGAQLQEERQTVVVKNSFLTIVGDTAEALRIPERLTKSIDLAFLDSKIDNLIMTCDAGALGYEEKVLSNPPTINSFSTCDCDDDCENWRSAMSHDFSSILDNSSLVDSSDESELSHANLVVSSRLRPEPQPLLESWRLSVQQQRIQHEHMCGECKPCAFVHTEKGCLNGINCQFCHEVHDKAYIKEASKRNRAKRLALMWSQKSELQ